MLRARLAVLTLGLAACGGSSGTGTDGITLADGLADPSNLAADQTSVYVSTSAAPRDGAILKVPKTGGSPVSLTHGQFLGGYSHAVAVDSTRVYFVVVDTHSGVTNTIMTVPTAGGSPQPLVPNRSSIYSITLDAANLYWTEPQTGSVVKAPKVGGSPLTLITGAAEPSVLAVDSMHVYWINRFAGLARMGLDGSNPTMLGTIAADSGPVLAIDSTHAYWGMNGYLEAVPKAGGQQVTLLPDYGTVGSDIATDGSMIYWLKSGTCGAASCNADGAVVKMPVAGGPQTVVAAGLTQPAALVLDQGYVYWIERGNGAVRRVAK